MDPDALRNLLTRLSSGELDVDAALRRLTHMPFEDLDFARLDHHRTLRCGFSEVIFGQCKTDAQLLEIFVKLAATGNNVLATRVAKSAALLVEERIAEVVYDETSRALSLRQRARTPGAGYVGIVAAGTGDLPVAEEARITADLMDADTRTFYDVGVAGLHRLLAVSEELRQANVLVVAAGMEGALPSVVGGLVNAPIIAAPTSIGYGASFGGISALLAMLNSCAPGVSVVNIDNGFGAGYQAAMINRLAACRNDKSAAPQPDSDRPRHD